VAYLGFRLLRRGGTAMLRDGFALFIIPLILCGSYVLANIVLTGHAMPVSAVAKKLLFARPFWTSWLEMTGGQPFGISACLFMLPLAGSLVVFLWAATTARGRQQFAPPFLVSVLLLNAGVACYYLYLFLHAYYYSLWYFAFPFAALFVTGVVFIDSCRFCSRFAFMNLNLKTVIVIAALLLSTSGSLRLLTTGVAWDNNTSYQLFKVAREVNRFCGPDAVIGTYDAGIVGFFAHCRVINLDGLINDFDYLENYLTPGRLQEYFNRQNLTHFLALEERLVNVDEVRQGNYRSAVFRADPRIRLPKENELFRYTNFGGFPVYLFKLTPEA
jgi:hypothetical protein